MMHRYIIFMIYIILYIYIYIYIYIISVNDQDQIVPWENYCYSSTRVVSIDVQKIATERLPWL